MRARSKVSESEMERVAREAGEELLKTGSFRGPRFKAAADFIGTAIQQERSTPEGIQVAEEVAVKSSQIVQITRDQIFSSDDIATEFVPVPEWAPKGVADKSKFGLTVRALSGRQRAAWQRDSMINKGKVQEVNYNRVTVKLVVMGVLGADGRQLFGAEDESRLLEKSAGALQRIANVVMRLSGISNDEVDTLTKNSEETEGDDSP